MTRHTVQIYTADGKRIFGRRIECDRVDVPGRLADITMDYFGDASYPDTMQALVEEGRRFTVYMIHLKNGTVTVYRHVFQCGMAAGEGAQETATGSPAPGDGEGAT